MSEIDQILAQMPMQQIAAELGVDESEAEQATRMALPALLGGMQANAADEAGALSLARALGQHDDSLLGADLSDVDVADGERIVGHVFGDQRDAVIAQLGGVRGAGGSGVIGKLLPMLAPIVLSYLARKLQQRGGLGGVLGNVVGGAAGGTRGGSVGQPGSSGDGGLGDILGGVLGGGAGGAGGGGLGDVLGGVLGGSGRSGGANDPTRGSGQAPLDEPNEPLIPGSAPAGGAGPAGGGLGHGSAAPSGAPGGVLGDILGQVLGGGPAGAGSAPPPGDAGGSVIDILGGLLGRGRR